MSNPLKFISAGLGGIQFKIIVGAGVCIALSTGTVMRVSGSLLDEALQSAASQDLQGRAGALAGDVQSRIEVAQTLARGLAQTLGGAVDEEFALDLEREAAQGILSKALLANPDLFDVFTAWGEDAFDGFDAAYEGVEGYPAGGRMALVVRRSSEGLAESSALSGVEEFAVGDSVAAGSYVEAFAEPLATNRSYHSAPIQLENGQWIQRIAVPIATEDEFFGVVGVSLSLEFTDGIANSEHGSASGFAMRLYAPSGAIVAQTRVAEAMPSGVFEALGSHSGQVFQHGLETYASAALGDSKNSMLLAVALPTASITGVSDAIMREQFRAGAWAICIALLATWLMARSIAKPLRKASHALADIGEGEGDLTQRLVEQGSGEPRELATGFNAFVAKLQALVRDVSVFSGKVDGSAMGLAGHSSHMLKQVTEASQLAQVSAKGAHEIQDEVDSVAHAIDEMTASISEIANNTSRASEIVGTVVATAEETNGNLSQLDEVSQEIEDVIALISGIANQTNLLSLNASIEAARAGESGKGFSVVAGEVKALASQTSEATSEIEKRIRSMQGCTKSVVVSVKEMSELVGEVDDLTQAIAGAVVQQNAVARTIGDSASAAASGCTSLAGNIQGVADSAQNIAHGATAAEQETVALSGLSERLNDLVGQFKV